MRSFGGVAVLIVAAVTATGCSTTTGTPVARTSDTATQDTVTSDRVTAPPNTSPTTPTGAPVGQAVMRVQGSAGGPVTIRYRINGGPEHTETNVSLPWQKSYPVFNELDTSVSADGGDSQLICTITMNGDKLVALQSGVRPVCDFSYWG